MRGGARPGAGRKPICPNGDKAETCSIRICSKLHERLKLWCKKHQTDKSGVINALIDEFLNDHEAGTQ